MVFDASLWVAYPACTSFMCIFPLAFLNNCSTLATSVQQNSCWCPNIPWLTNVASCVGQFCPTEVAQVYSTIKTLCSSNGGFQTGITLDEWITESQRKSPSPVVSGQDPVGYEAYPACSQYMCLLPDGYANPCAHIGNLCICNNVTEIEGWAKCIGINCPGDVAAVYSQAIANCRQNGGYNVAVSLQDFVAVAEGRKAVQSFTPSAVPTATKRSTYLTTGTDGTPSTATESPTIDSQPSSTGSRLSLSDNIALGVGLGVGLPSLVLSVIGIVVGWKTYQQRIVEVATHQGRNIRLGNGII